MSYVVKCDECKTTLRETESLRESAAGGLCAVCQPCRGCGQAFPFDPDADYCPACAAENAGEEAAAMREP